MVTNVSLVWKPDETLTLVFEILLKIQTFVACDMEMNLAWNLTEMERLTLYYDSVAAGMLSLSFFRFEQDSLQNRVCGVYVFLRGETQKAINRLKGFGSR